MQALRNSPESIKNSSLLENSLFHAISEEIGKFRVTLKNLNDLVKLCRFPDHAPAPAENPPDDVLSIQPKEETKEESSSPAADWKFYSGNPKYFESPEQTPRMVEQIKVSIHMFYYKKEKNNGKSKRGRPEVVKDTSEVALQRLMKKWELELIKRLSRDQRSDAFFASVGRYIKKIPDLFLKYIGSKCQYKSKDMRLVLRSYLKCFMAGFLEVFPLCQRDYCLKGFLDIFLDFCILSFPDAKCQILLKDLYGEKAISKEEYIRKMECCKIRIKASKLSYRELYDKNNCFQLICAKLESHFKILEGVNLKRIQNVLKFFNTNAEIYNISIPMKKPP